MTSTFFLRPSIRLASAIPKTTLSKPVTVRAAFHSFRSTARSPTLTATANRQLTTASPFRQQSRSYNYNNYGNQAPPIDSRTRWRKIATSAAIFGGTLVTINVVFNSEGRTDGGMSSDERSYLNDAFIHTGMGVATIGLTAQMLVRSGVAWRVMMANPMVVVFGGLAASIGSMMATRAIDPDNRMAKYAAWTAFNATQAVILCPLAAFAPPAILARAGLYTVAMMGGLSVVGATAREDKYLYIGGPLMAGACIVMASGIAPLLLPATAMRSLALMESVWLYGGLALTGGFTLYHVQAIQERGRAYSRGLIKRDPISEAVALELDFINMFTRIVFILMSRGDNRRR